MTEQDKLQSRPPILTGVYRLIPEGQEGAGQLGLMPVRVGHPEHSPVEPKPFTRDQVLFRYLLTGAWSEVPQPPSPEARRMLIPALNDFYIRQEIRSPLVESQLDPESSKDITPGPLQPRELEVLWYLIQGQSRKEIALRLQKSSRTIDAFFEHMGQRLGTTSIYELHKLGKWAALQGILQNLPQDSEKEQRKSAFARNIHEYFHSGNWPQRREELLADVDTKLAEKQRVIFGYWSKGASLPDIAHKEGVSVKTIETQLERIYNKLGRTRVEVVQLMYMPPLLS